MSIVRVIASDRPELAPFEMPDRFRREVVYFMSPGDLPGAPSLTKNQYWIKTEDIDRWLADGEFQLVSPLDAESVAEIELSEEQEQWLEWMSKNQITKIEIS